MHREPGPSQGAPSPPLASPLRTGSPAAVTLTLPACLPSPSAGETLVDISSLPEWAQPGFKGMKSLNRIQSRVCDTALYSAEVGGVYCSRTATVPHVHLPVWSLPPVSLCLASPPCCACFPTSPSPAPPLPPQNMLVCAPTGAGKTNVAMLAMLHEIGLHR